MKIPDYFEPLIGWRAWGGVTPEFHLKPLADMERHGVISWPHYKPAQSLCNCCGNIVKPAQNNSFGMYAFKKVLDLYKETRAPIVIGQVYLWGTVIECGTKEFRLPCPMESSCIYDNRISYNRDGTKSCSIHGPAQLIPLVKGWRAEFAYPKHLLTWDQNLLEPLSTAYGVPCEDSNFDQAMKELMARHHATIPKKGF